MLWLDTLVLRILAGLAQDKITLVGILDDRLVFPRFEMSEGKITSSGEERKDEKRQADAEEELHEHLRIYCWRGVSAVRHFWRRDGLVVGCFGRDSSRLSVLYLEGRRVLVKVR